ncbi:hypothetical protein QQF64_007983 [Cirrhinus molitorella]|uniref:Uncharacterized protein n=1 Tax=Cirrhinus molitorella TaxID=172907 RepID=A0ABR3M7D6_9TELE
MPTCQKAQKALRPARGLALHLLNSSSAKTIGRIVSDARDKSTRQAPFGFGTLKCRSFPQPTERLRLAGPYHLGESSRGPEGYRYLERASGLVLATAAHILKLDRYRED